MVDIDQLRVLVVMGSTRSSRRCPEIAAWVLQQTSAFASACFELIDLRDWPLPVDGEPELPARGIYDQPSTQAWSRKVASAAAFIFVTPQYNWGYPAPLKNAIDHLYKEWAQKPAIIIAYGGHGGDKCAHQLRQVLEAVKMRPVTTMPALTLSHAVIEGGPLHAANDFAPASGTVAQALDELIGALLDGKPELRSS